MRNEIEKTNQTIDVTVPRRRYFSDDCITMHCPECGSDLIEERCSILLAVKCDTDAAEFMTRVSGSHFCPSCPVVVFDKKTLGKVAKLAMRGKRNIQYDVIGIIDFDAVPEEKKNMVLGTDENPIPIIDFLPALNRTTIKNSNKIGRNEPCPCGSGKKYKKCCR